MQTVAIVGVGLIGGSFAKAIRAAGYPGRILGVSSPAVARQAVELGVIDAAVSLEDAAAQAELLYLSQPIKRILELLPRLDAMARPDALITDAGSTKSLIVQTARNHIKRALFVGGHPMAGKESRGVDNADAELFRGRTYLLTPIDPADLERPPVIYFRELLEKIGARVSVMSAGGHDRAVALTSHLPQLVSTALAAALSSTLPDGDLIAAGPGLLDTTRLAASPYEIWQDILDTNRAAVDTALGAVLTELQLLRDGLERGDVSASFERAAGFRRRLEKAVNG
ncbi:MAG: prephenate dehydrogenase/arogenate dehydrogenase family protein [Bryobacteraceae bacterium]